MPSEILEHNEANQNDNITESIVDSLDQIKPGENVCVLNNHWRVLVKAHEKRLTEKDEVINALEKQLEAHQVIEDKDVKSRDFMDAFTLLRHKIQELEQFKMTYINALNDIHNLVDKIEETIL